VVDSAEMRQGLIVYARLAEDKSQVDCRYQCSSADGWCRSECTVTIMAESAVTVIVTVTKF
jgi:hypothetical protein